MTQLTLHSISADSAFQEALREVLEERRDSNLRLELHDPTRIPRLSLDRNAETVLLLDADSFGEGTFELLARFDELGTIVIGSASQSEVLGNATIMYDSEMLLKDREGQFVTMIPHTIRRIVHRRDQEMTTRDMLRSSEGRFEHLVQALPDVVYKIDPEGYFTFVNDSVRIFGFTPEELIGRHFSTIITDEDLSKVSRRGKLRLYQGRETGDDEAPGLFDERRTGERRTRGLEFRVKAPEDPDAQDMVASVTAYGEITATGHYLEEAEERYFTGTVGVIRDITHRRRSEERLMELSLSIDQISVGVCICSAQGMVRYANPFFFRLNMVEPGRVLGHNIWPLARRTLQEDTLAHITAAMRAGEPWEEETIVWKRSGESSWSWLKVYPVRNVAGEVAQYIVLQQDLTEIKQTEMSLRQSMERQRLSLRSMQHRVRSALEMMSALSYHLREDEGPDPIRPEALLEFLSLFHAFAYESNDPERCDIGLFLTESLPGLVPARTRRNRKVQLSVHVESAGLALETALPLAVAAASLTATTVNHSFPGERRRPLRITGGRRENEVIVTVDHPGEDPLWPGEEAEAGPTTPAADGGAPAELLAALLSPVNGRLDTRVGEKRTVHTITVPWS